MSKTLILLIAYSQVILTLQMVTEKETTDENIFLTTIFQDLFSEKRNDSLEAKEVNEECINSEQCQAATSNTVCSNHTCSCDTMNPLYFHEKCIAAAEIGEGCITSLQCKLTTAHSDCIDGLCQCEEKHILIFEMQTCVKAKYIGETCDAHLECNVGVNNSLCINSKCSCSVHHPIYISKIKSCLKATKIGEPCAYNEQCNAAAAKSHCFLDKCACLPNYPVTVNGNCYKKTNLGYSCESSDQCKFMTPQSYCKIMPGSSEGVCECLKGFSSHGNKCIQEESYTIFTSSTKSPSKSSNMLLIIIASSVGGSVLILLLIIIIIIIRNKEIKFQFHWLIERRDSPNVSRISINASPGINNKIIPGISSDGNSNNLHTIEKSYDNLLPSYDSVIHEISFPSRKPVTSLIAHNFLLNHEDDKADHQFDSKLQPGYL